VDLLGSNKETVFVGGAGTQTIFGGLGANIVTELSVGDSSTIGNGYDIVTNFDPAKDVVDLSHIDANLTASGVQNFTFIGTAAFSGSGAQVRYQQDPTNNYTYVEADLAGDSGNALPDVFIKLSGLRTLTAANFALTTAQSTADLANGAALSKVSTIYYGSATEDSYTNVQGRNYSSYQSFWSNWSTIAAENLNLSATANEIDLSGSGVTITRGSGSESLQVGTGSFSLGYHPTETIEARAAGPETFVFGANFGAETINGLTSSDTIQLTTSSFSGLPTGMSQAQDLAWVLAHDATSTSSGTTIMDSHGDTLALHAVAASTLTASQLHFV